MYFLYTILYKFELYVIIYIMNILIIVWGDNVNKTKKLIFDAAVKCFSKKGFHKSTMDEIAETAGVAKGTLYYHFKSKEDIFKFVIDEGMTVIVNEINDKTAKLDNPVDKVAAVCEVQFQMTIKYIEFFRTVLSQMWGDEERQLQLREALKKYFEVIEINLKEAIDKGLIEKCNVEVIAFNIFGVITSTVLYNNTHEDVNFDELSDTVINFIMNGINQHY